MAKLDISNLLHVAKSRQTEQQYWLAVKRNKYVVEAVIVSIPIEHIIVTHEVTERISSHDTYLAGFTSLCNLIKDRDLLIFPLQDDSTISQEYPRHEQ